MISQSFPDPFFIITLSTILRKTGMHEPLRKNQCFLTRKRVITAARIPAPIPAGACGVGTCAGDAVCTGSGDVTGGRVVTGGRLSVVVGRIVTGAVSGVVKISIGDGAFRE